MKSPKYDHECAWTRRVCKEMSDCNAAIVPIVANQYMPAGYPDRHVIHTYWMGWLEFKGVDTAIRPIQRVRLKFIRERWPTLAYVVRKKEGSDAGQIEDEEGRVLGEFDGSGLHLLRTLKEVSDAGGKAV